MVEIPQFEPKENVMKKTAGLRLFSANKAQAVIFQISETDGIVQLSFRTSGIYNDRSLAIAIPGAEENLHARKLCEKLREVATLINKLHEEDPKNLLFVPGEKINKK